MMLRQSKQEPLDHTLIQRGLRSSPNQFLPVLELDMAKAFNEPVLATFVWKFAEDNTFEVTFGKNILNKQLYIRGNLKKLTYSLLKCLQFKQ